MAVVDDRRVGCDGCDRTVPLEDLTAVTMPGGQRVACCPDCVPHARTVTERDGSLDQRRAACDGCADTVLATDLEEVTLEDGTAVACCPSCVSEARGYEGGTETGSSAASGSGADGDRPRCSQCRERVREEPFRVTTIDDRTERLCPDCKADAETRGVVADVAMRTTEAREVLGVDADATDAELRAAFHRQVKRAHPDRKSGSRSAFELVREAYERLREDE